MASTQTGLPPHMQAVRIAFRSTFAVMMVAALAWATSNIRSIPPQNRAVVLRFGRLDRVQNAGLMLAWAPPVEEVVLVPDPAQVLSHQVEGLKRSAEASSGSTGARFQGDALAGSGYLLTADASVVHLDVNVFYRVTDPLAYVLQGPHVAPALDRLATRAAVIVCASRDLDSILVARPELVASDPSVAERREQLRADLVDRMNSALRQLALEHEALGVEIERADVQSSLPVNAVTAFDAVLTASQAAEQEVASARNDAVKRSQAASQAAELAIQRAHAEASERVAQAHRDTAVITSLAKATESGTDPGLPQRIYRDKIATILSQAGSVVTVQPGDDKRLILQGADQ